MFLLTLWQGPLPPNDPTETMRNIVLIRHAKSSWDNPNLADFDRPLGERGLKDAPDMAKELAKYQLPIDLVIASPSRRTTETLAYFSTALRIPDNKIVWDSTVYHSGTENLMRLISNLPDSIHYVVVVGHNPSMTDFANALESDTLIENVPTCGIVHVSGNWPSWQDIRKKKGKLELFIYPKGISK